VGKRKNAPELEEQEWELEDIEPVESDRVLVLKKEPLPRKLQLIDAGAKEIRCLCCVRIRPIAEAEELGDGWICGECAAEAEEARRYGELATKAR
jgi:hypothetical protein